MRVETKMNRTFAIRADEETMEALTLLKDSTGLTTAHLVRLGLQKTIAQFKRDGFLKIEATQTAETTSQP